MGGGAGTSSQSQASQQSSTFQPPPWLLEAGQQAIQSGDVLQQSPFQVPVQPIAGFSPQQAQAFQQVQNMQGMTQPFTEAGSALNAMGAFPNIGQYFGAESSGVMDELKNLDAQQMAQTTGNAATQAGGLGADRIAIAQSELANQQNLAAGATLSGLMGQSVGQAQTGAGLQQQAGMNLGQLGNQALTEGLQGTQAEFAAGSQQQQQQQNIANSQYQNVLQQIGWPYQTTSYLAEMAGGMAPTMGGSGVGTGFSQSSMTASPLTQMGQAKGLMGGLGGGMQGKGMNSGGRIPMAAGGSLYSYPDQFAPGATAWDPGNPANPGQPLTGGMTSIAGGSLSEMPAISAAMRASGGPAMHMKGGGDTPPPPAQSEEPPPPYTGPLQPNFDVAPASLPFADVVATPSSVDMSGGMPVSDIGIGGQDVSRNWANAQPLGAPSPGPSFLSEAGNFFASNPMVFPSGGQPGATGVGAFGTEPNFTSTQLSFPQNPESHTPVPSALHVDGLSPSQIFGAFSQGRPNSPPVQVGTGPINAPAAGSRKYGGPVHMQGGGNPHPGSAVPQSNLDAAQLIAAGYTQNPDVPGLFSGPGQVGTGGTYQNNSATWAAPTPTPAPSAPAPAQQPAPHVPAANVIGNATAAPQMNQPQSNMMSDLQRMFGGMGLGAATNNPMSPEQAFTNGLGGIGQFGGQGGLQNANPGALENTLANQQAGMLSGISGSGAYGGPGSAAPGPVFPTGSPQLGTMGLGFDQGGAVGSSTPFDMPQQGTGIDHMGELQRLMGERSQLMGMQPSSMPHGIPQTPFAPPPPPRGMQQIPNTSPGAAGWLTNDIPNAGQGEPPSTQGMQEGGTIAQQGLGYLPFGAPVAPADNPMMGLGGLQNFTAGNPMMGAGSKQSLVPGVSIHAQPSQGQQAVQGMNQSMAQQQQQSAHDAAQQAQAQSQPHKSQQHGQGQWNPNDPNVAGGDTSTVGGLSDAAPADVGTAAPGGPFDFGAAGAGADAAGAGAAGVGAGAAGAGAGAGGADLALLALAARGGRQNYDDGGDVFSDPGMGYSPSSGPPPEMTQQSMPPVNMADPIQRMWSSNPYDPSQQSAPYQGAPVQAPPHFTSNASPASVFGGMLSALPGSSNPINAPLQQSEAQQVGFNFGKSLYPGGANTPGIQGAPGTQSGAAATPELTGAPNAMSGQPFNAAAGPTMGLQGTQSGKTDTNMPSSNPYAQPAQQGPQTPQQVPQPRPDPFKLASIGSGTPTPRPRSQAGGPIDRSAFKQQLQNPYILQRLSGMVKGETGYDDPVKAQIQLETVFNRAMARAHQTGGKPDLMQALRAKGEGPGYYYDRSTYGHTLTYQDTSRFNQLLRNVMNGSNTGYKHLGFVPTGNASNPGRGRDPNFASRRLASGQYAAGKFYGNNPRNEMYVQERADAPFWQRFAGDFGRSVGAVGQNFQNLGRNLHLPQLFGQGQASGGRTGYQDGGGDDGGMDLSSLEGKSVGDAVRMAPGRSGYSDDVLASQMPQGMTPQTPITSDMLGDPKSAQTLSQLSGEPLNVVQEKQRGYNLARQRPPQQPGVSGDPNDPSTWSTGKITPDQWNADDTPQLTADATGTQPNVSRETPGRGVRYAQVSGQPGSSTDLRPSQQMKSKQFNDSFFGGLSRALIGWHEGTQGLRNVQAIEQGEMDLASHREAFDEQYRNGSPEQVAAAMTGELGIMNRAHKGAAETAQPQGIGQGPVGGDGAGAGPPQGALAPQAAQAPQQLPTNMQGMQNAAPQDIMRHARSVSDTLMGTGNPQMMQQGAQLANAIATGDINRMRQMLLMQMMQHPPETPNIPIEPAPPGSQAQGAPAATPPGPSGGAPPTQEAASGPVGAPPAPTPTGGPPQAQAAPGVAPMVAGAPVQLASTETPPIKFGPTEQPKTAAALDQPQPAPVPQRQAQAATPGPSGEGAFDPRAIAGASLQPGWQSDPAGYARELRSLGVQHMQEAEKQERQGEFLGQRGWGAKELAIGQDLFKRALEVEGNIAKGAEEQTKLQSKIGAPVTSAPAPETPRSKSFERITTLPEGDMKSLPRNEFGAESVRDAGKKMAEKIDADADGAGGAKVRLRELQDALENLPHFGPLSSGPGLIKRSEWAKSIQATAQKFGIDIKSIANQAFGHNVGDRWVDSVADVDAAVKLQTQLGFALVGETLGKREAQQVIEAGIKTNPGGELTRESWHKITYGMDEVLNRMTDRRQAKDNWMSNPRAGYYNLEGFGASFDKHNEPERYANRAMTRYNAWKQIDAHPDQRRGIEQKLQSQYGIAPEELGIPR